MATRYVDINNSFSTNGIGSTMDPYNWAQFITELSGGGTEGLISSNNYYLSGTRTVDDGTSIVISATSAVNLYSRYENNPPIIQSIGAIYFEQYVPNLALYDLLIEANITATDNSLFDDGTYPGDNGNLIIDNCYLKVGSRIRFRELDSLVVRNSIVITTNLEGYANDNMTMSFVNTIFDIANFNATTADNVSTVTIDNCAFTSAVTAFTNDTTGWTNIHSEWTRPNVFSSAVSAISITTNLNYLSADFASISATGNTSYTNTWLSGTRDGIGALYFPTISGVAVEIVPPYMPPIGIGMGADFDLSGNDPFTVFSASSATYNFDGGAANKVVNTNDSFTISFSAANIYQVSASILSFNEWYSIEAVPFTAQYGNLNVSIKIYNAAGTEVSTAKLLQNLTFSASFSQVPAGTYSWDMDDTLTGNTIPETKNYTIVGTKTIALTVSALEDTTVTATTSTTLAISATSAEYFVNITSAYDICASNSGTSADPFNWNEFKGMVETSGNYLDTYRLSGSRALSATTSDRYVLKVDKRKNMTIRDWDVSACGPWVLEVDDFSTLDQNSILSAAGCTLQNGIIYNKPFSSPIKGGKIFIGTTYDMFIVYQGQYSHIVVEPYSNVLIDPVTADQYIATSASSKIIGSTIYLSGSGWQDLFLSADFSAVGETKYPLELTDSVLIKFTPSDTSYFCACSATIAHCTFDRAQSAISADFSTIISHSQFDWSPPADYPFTPSNALYGQDIIYIIANKKKLRPFTNITYPPNAGKNYPDYPNYTTGLFGYARKDYKKTGL